MRFVNPYNFIPFEKEKSTVRAGRDKVYHSGEALSTGWLEVEMEVKSPLLIPDAAHPHYLDIATGKERTNLSELEKNNVHKKYDFYHLGDGAEKKYLVPGSELRGMVRAMYEAVTNSCFPFLLHEKPMSQRVPIYGSINKRGLLEYDKSIRKWKLWSTTVLTQKALVENGDIKIGDRKYLCGEFIEGKGYVQCNVPVSTGKPYHVAFLQKYECVFQWDSGIDVRKDEPYRQMASILERDGALKNQRTPNDTQRSSLLNKLEKVIMTGGAIPVRYFIVKDENDMPIVYMSNSSIGRIAPRRKWEEIIDSEHKPCEDVEQLCPACLLFGTIKGNGLQGHVRFTDAIAEGEIHTKERTIGILGQPRPSAFEFYLDKPEKKATYWNYDFYGVKKIDKNGKPYTEYRHLTKALPRGRKMYWHGEMKEDERRKLNATMESVEEGKFVFRVYFDRISKQQLDTLIWAISLGENTADSSRCHKLGHAKPLGYGSVKLCVKKQYIREITGEIAEGIRIVVKESQPAEPKHTPLMVGADSPTFRSILAMCDRKSVAGKEVRYPQLLKKNGKDDIFQWFAGNHTNADRLMTLPYPTDADITLEGSWNADTKSVAKGYAVQSSETKPFNGGAAKSSGKTANTKYKAKAVGYKNGKEGTPFYVVLELEEDNSSVSMPYFVLKRGDDATCISIGEEYTIIYSEVNDKGYPKWKKY